MAQAARSTAIVLKVVPGERGFCAEVMIRRNESSTVVPVQVRNR